MVLNMQLMQQRNILMIVKLFCMPYKLLIIVVQQVQILHTWLKMLVVLN